MVTPPGVAELEACCRLSYGHPAARWLMGDSFHPGGLDLTTELAGLLKLGPGDTVLDAGSGLGATAVHLARRFGCRVTGVTLEPEGVQAGHKLADEHGVADLAVFNQGDIRAIKPEAPGYDAVLIECVLSIMPDKLEVLSHLARLLKPGGMLGITDVTVDGALPDELDSLFAKAGCVGGAVSLAEYQELLLEAGFVVALAQDRREAAVSFVHALNVKLEAAGLAAAVGVLPVESGLLDEARRLLGLARDLVRRGTLGYGLIVARIPH